MNKLIDVLGHKSIDVKVERFQSEESISGLGEELFVRIIIITEIHGDICCIRLSCSHNSIL